MVRDLADSEDNKLSRFLDLLDRDITANPGRIVFATAAFADYLSDLTRDVAVDYDALIEGAFRL